jgi:Skp family chaperone for outer membrane proteins
MNFQTLTVTALVAGFFAAGVVAQTPAAQPAAPSASAVAAGRAAVNADKEKLSRDKAMRADPAVIKADQAQLDADQKKLKADRAQLHSEKKQIKADRKKAKEERSQATCGQKGARRRKEEAEGREQESQSREGPAAARTEPRVCSSGKVGATCFGPQPPRSLRVGAPGLSGHGLAAVAVDELLDGACGCVMRLFLVPQQCEGRAELRVQLAWAVAHDGQTAASVRAVFGKGGNDHMAAWLHGTQHGLYVGLPLFGACQEMKDGAVMPDVVGVEREIGLGDVGLDPLNRSGFCAQPLLRCRQPAAPDRSSTVSDR